MINNGLRPHDDVKFTRCGNSRFRTKANAITSGDYNGHQFKRLHVSAPYSSVCDELSMGALRFPKSGRVQGATG